MRDLAFVAFLGGPALLGLKRPFLFVLAYIYVDTVSPQRLSYILLNSRADLDDRRRAGDRRLGARRRQGRTRASRRARG